MQHCDIPRLTTAAYLPPERPAYYLDRHSDRIIRIVRRQAHIAMTRPRKSSAASEESQGAPGNQELGSMYDYLAKIILLGPSGTGK